MYNIKKRTSSNYLLRMRNVGTEGIHSRWQMKLYLRLKNIWNCNWNFQLYKECLLWMRNVEKKKLYIRNYRWNCTYDWRQVQLLHLLASHMACFLRKEMLVTLNYLMLKASALSYLQCGRRSSSSVDACHQTLEEYSYQKGSRNKIRRKGTCVINSF